MRGGGDKGKATEGDSTPPFPFPTRSLSHLEQVLLLLVPPPRPIRVGVSKVFTGCFASVTFHFSLLFIRISFALQIQLADLTH